MTWYAYIGAAAALAVVVFLTRSVAKPLVVVMALALEMNVMLYLGQWDESSLWVGESGPRGFAIPLIGIVAASLLSWRWLLGPDDRRGPALRYVAWPTTGAAALIGIATAATIFYSPERRIALYYLNELLWWYVVFMVPLNFVTSPRDVQRFVKLLLLVLGTQAVIYYIQNAANVTFTATGDVFVPLDEGGVTRHGGTVSYNAKGFAMFISPLLLLAVAHVLTTSSRALKWGCGLLSGMGLAALILSSTRAAWVGFCLGLAWMIVVGAAGRRVYLRRVAIIGVIGVVAVAILWPSIATRLNRDYRADYEERAFLMRVAWRVIGENPVLGVGAGAYGFVVRRYVLPEERGKWLYVVHNGYLLRWAETGLLGLTGFLFLLLGGLRGAVACSRAGDELRAALGLGVGAGIIHLSWEMLWDHSLGGTTPYLLWFMLGLIAAARRIPATESARAMSRVPTRFWNASSHTRPGGGAIVHAPGTTASTGLPRLPLPGAPLTGLTRSERFQF